MKKLFDLLNSGIRNGLGSKATWTTANFEDKKCKMLSFYSWLRSLKIKDGDREIEYKFVEKTRKKTCIIGFCTTIMSMIDLFQDLSEVEGENIQLFTRHIQQDYLE